MKYKLINKTTGIETLCEKVTIDGFDYYVSDNHINKLKPNAAYHTIVENPRRVVRYTKHIQDTTSGVIICTNNPIIDIPKVVDGTWIFFKEVDGTCEKDQYEHWLYKSGYNKSQETHPFSEEDMIEFNEWCNKSYEFDNRCNQWFYGNGYYTTKELLQLWKEQKPKTLYYV
jgi:hypothetical protein